MLTDGDRIKDLLAGRNQAAFAREHGIPGGASMVTQHITGHRPVSVEAAIAYARGLGVPLDAVSPAAADLVRNAIPLAQLATKQIAGATPNVPSLADALPVVLEALAGLPPARAASVRAQLELVMGHPEMHDDVVAELQTLLQARPGKRLDAA